MPNPSVPKYLKFLQAFPTLPEIEDVSAFEEIIRCQERSSDEPMKGSGKPSSDGPRKAQTSQGRAMDGLWQISIR